MKLQLLSLLTAAIVMVSCGSSRTTTTTSANSAYDVPGTIQTSFTTQYPTAGNVVWSRYDVATVPVDWELNGWTALDNNDYAVVFDMEGNRYYAWYDDNGNWVGSSYSMTDHTGLPAAVNSVISSRYQGYTIDKIERESWKDHTGYEIKLKNGDNRVKLLVDDNGNVIKEKTKW